MYSFIVLMVLLNAKHLIVDFFAQTPYQYLNKGTYLHPGGLIHSGLHVAATFLIIILFFPYTPLYLIAIALVSEYLIHYHMDWLKVNVCKRYKYDPTNSEKYWWWLGIDQFVHQMNYLLIVWLVLYK